MGTSIEVIDDRTNKNTGDITKIFKVLFGNGSGGGIVSDVKSVKTNLSWIKWLVTLNITVVVGAIIRSLFVAL